MFAVKRLSGIGDVLMLLPVLHILKRRTGRPVVLVTGDTIADILRHGGGCGLDAVATEAQWRASANDLTAQGADFHDLDQAAFSLERRHQIDAFLAIFGQTADEQEKGLHLPRPEYEQMLVTGYLDEVDPEPQGPRVLLHPAVSAENRTYPAQHWQTLAERLDQAGYSVFAIGNNHASAGKGCHALDIDPDRNLIDRFSFWQTLELMRQSDVLISTDSAPIHMAGATEIAIVNIASIVPGAWRMPFRTGHPGLWSTSVEPDCPYFPCYPSILEPDCIEAVAEDMKVRGNKFLFDWCRRPDARYDCLRRDITPERILAALPPRS